LPLSSFLLLSLPLLLKEEHILRVGMTKFLLRRRGLVSGVIFAPQAPLSISLMPYGPNYGTAELFSQVEGGSAIAGTCDMTGDCDSLPQVSQQVTSDIVIHNCDLWDGEYHVTSVRTWAVVTAVRS